MNNINNNHYKKLVIGFTIVSIAVFSFVIGVYAAQKKVVRIPFGNRNVAEAATVKNTDLDLFFSVWNTLKDKSIYAKNVKDEDMIYGAIEGLAASLGDPYTQFMPPQKAKEFNESISGSFDGIGAEVGIKEQILTIIAPLKDSPAQIAGIRSGDKIISIDGISTADMNIDNAISKIRGKKGTVVDLEIYRAGEKETRNIKVTRDTIVVPTIKTEIKDGVFIIHIYTFGEKVKTEFANAVKEYNKSNLPYLIIDLRDDPGGYLDAAVDISSYFVPKGKTIVSEDFVKNSKKQVHVSYGYNDLKNKSNVVVLIDGGSASASEIVAGALRDNKIAKLVGVKSFGKGSVQELLPMKNGTNLKITIAKWLTPNGDAIDKNGIKPDIEVKRIYDDKNPKLDNQLDKAIEIVKAK